MTAVPPAIVGLPRVPDALNFKDLGPLLVFLSNQQNALVRELTRRIVKDVAIDEILLRSPNGSVYRVVVGDTGTLSTQVVYQSP